MLTPLVPPFTAKTAALKVKAAEDVWNTRDPERVAEAYTEDAEWRNRDEFFTGRTAIVEFLMRKWAKELDYKLIKELWAFTDNRISVRFEYEWRDSETGQWYRTHGNEHWEFAPNGLMRRRDMSANDIPIKKADRRITGLPSRQLNGSYTKFVKKGDTNTMTRSNDTPHNGLTLVIGATGKTGRRVAERLVSRGVPIRAASRSSEIPFDWENEATWSPAVDGVRAAYITYFPDLAVPSAPGAIAKFSRLAVERGVKHLVLLSGRGEEEAQRCEQIIKESGAEWTVVRASWFSQNFSEAFFVEPLRHGVLALPAGDVKEPFVDADDIADVVVTALTEDGHSGRVYEVTGPRTLTFAEAVSEIAKATGREIRFVDVSNEEFVAQLKEHGTPQEVVDLTVYLFNTVLDGRNSKTTDGVQRALGRPPRDFSDYVKTTSPSGVWEVRT